MELVRQEMRKLTLDNFKDIRTCVLARELCALVRSSKAALNAEDAHHFCGFIASLCKEAGCRDTSNLCAEAAEIVVRDEKRHLELCEQSYLLCYEGRFPAKPHADRALYIT